MKSFLIGGACLLIAGGTAIRLYERWQEERIDHHIAILADWAEVRDVAARQGMTDQQLLERLAASGANALLVSPSTVEDYRSQEMTFRSRPLAEAVQRQLVDRGVVGVSLKANGRSFKLMNAARSWESLKDVELGFNPELLGLARQAGFHLVLRVNNDPWLPREKLFADISEITSANQDVGVLLNTDEVPGGPDAVPAWASLLESQGATDLLFEFHPAKSAVKLTIRSPQTTYRAHTIPTAELKDLTPDQTLSRWRRAVDERSCRFLLFHFSPNDALPDFLENINATAQDFVRRGWSIGWPKPRVFWRFPSFLQRTAGPLVALLVAIAAPILALRRSLTRSPGSAYVAIFLLTLAGACVMAALADNPLSRLEVVPFHGVKLAFALAWMGSFLMLYTGKEIADLMNQNIRWMEVVLTLAAAAVAAYVLVRSGNAGSGWKAGWEQGLRDRLEFIFVARPRFKEFAIGYPLLLYGLKQNRRFLIGLGMIGPISMVNTFCHLHSPLYLAFFRSANGFLLGTLIGSGLLFLKKCRS